MKSRALDQKTHLTDLAICYLDQIKHHLLISAGDIEGFEDFSKMIATLLTENQAQLLQFDLHN